MIQKIRYNDFIEEVENCKFHDFKEIESIAKNFSTEVTSFTTDKIQLLQAFDADSISTIIDNLRGLQSEEANEILKRMDSHSAMGVILSNEVYNRGRGQSLAQCLKNEFRTGVSNEVLLSAA